MFGPIKVAVVGESAVGKTSIIMRWSSGKHNKNYEPTLENTVDGLVTVANTPRAVTAIDTPGDEDCEALRCDYMRRCDAVMFVYDVTRPNTFQKIHDDYWPTALSVRNEDVVPCVLVGNKTDCVRSVTPRQGKELAREMSASAVLEMSARDESTGRTKAIRAMAEAAAAGHRARTPRIVREKKVCCVLW